MEVISTVCHTPKGGGCGKIGVTYCEVFQATLDLCLVQQVQVGMGSKYLFNAPFPTALRGGI